MKYAPPPTSITIKLHRGSAAILRAYAEYRIVGETLEETATFLLERAIGELVGTIGFRDLLKHAEEARLEALAAKLKRKAR